MQRAIYEITIEELIDLFPTISFPEYQREPDVWSEDQKQKLIDSVLRNFDISSIYLYEVADSGGLECIDGRQRLNAVMSFLGRNPSDGHDGFRIKFENEVADGVPNEFAPLNGLRFTDLEAHEPLGPKALEAILTYPISFVYLAGAREPSEFNLQFLRLNLGTLINAGEKLHAMVGNMRNAIFLEGGLGKHPFLESVNIPTRRYAREQTAAQIMLQVFAFDERSEFARARHFDLQKFLKQTAEIELPHPLMTEVIEALNVLNRSSEALGGSLKNRAMTITVVLRAWRMRLFEAEDDTVDSFVSFLLLFLGRLRWQAKNMRDYHASSTYGYLVEFQRHLTQASVEKPAVTARDRILEEQFEYWLGEGVLEGDRAYEEEKGEPPPTA
jgi:hypothetical protein